MYLCMYICISAITSGIRLVAYHVVVTPLYVAICRKYAHNNKKPDSISKRIAAYFVHIMDFNVAVSMIRDTSVRQVMPAMRHEFTEN